MTAKLPPWSGPETKEKHLPPWAEDFVRLLASLVPGTERGDEG
jgi:hypothetical protein